MEELQAVECSRCFWLLYRGREPPRSQQLLGMVLCLRTSTEVEPNFVYAITIQDHKVIVGAGGWVDAALAHFVS